MVCCVGGLLNASRPVRPKTEVDLANWHKGLTRIVRVTQIGLLCLGIGTAINYKPEIDVNFRSDGPNEGWVLDKTAACIRDVNGQMSWRPGFGNWDDRYEVFGDIPAYVQMCLTSRISSKGIPVIPVVENGGTWLGFPKDTPQALDYARSRSSSFSLTPEVRAQAEAEAQSTYRTYWLSTASRIAITILSTIFGLELAWRVLAWIIRGFAEKAQN